MGGKISHPSVLIGHEARIAEHAAKVARLKEKGRVYRLKRNIKCAARGISEISRHALRQIERRARLNTNDTLATAHIERLLSTTRWVGRTELLSRSEIRYAKRLTYILDAMIVAGTVESKRDRIKRTQAPGSQGGNYGTYYRLVSNGPGPQAGV